MKIITLVENKSCVDGLKNERGLSYYIEYMDKKIIFDFGNSKLFYENASNLDIDIKNVDFGVVSHRHHDHINGLRFFLTKNKRAKAYLRRCDNNRYLFKAGIFKSDVGYNIDYLYPFLNRLIFSEGIQEIYPGIFLFNKFIKNYSLPLGNKYLHTLSNNKMMKDNFDHELMLVIKENSGIAIFTGCAHHGILNMIETAVSYFPGYKLKAVVGGFHLVNLPIFNGLDTSSSYIKCLIEDLDKYNVENFYTGHCTGSKAFRLLQTHFKERMHYASTGFTVEI